MYLLWWCWTSDYSWRQYQLCQVHWHPRQELMASSCLVFWRKRIIFCGWQCAYSQSPSCRKLFIYQLFWTQACPGGMCKNTTQVPCEVPSLPNPTTRKGWPHHRDLRPLLFSNSDVGSFTSHKNKSVKVLWDGTCGFSSLSEKDRKSNQLQMSLQRQHFLLSYFKTLSVVPAGGLNPATSRSADRRSLF